MKFAGIEIRTQRTLQENVIILESEREKLTVNIAEEPPYYILSRANTRGGMDVVEHGELGGKAHRSNGRS